MTAESNTTENNVDQQPENTAVSSAGANAETTGRTHTIDAAGKRLGKVATEAASVLMGKDRPDFAKHTVENVRVLIQNAAKLDIPEHKQSEIYQRYSGYPGGRKTERLDHLAKRLGYGEVLRRTIEGMLPKNKLQRRMMKHLEVTE